MDNIATVPIPCVPTLCSCYLDCVCPSSRWLWLLYIEASPLLVGAQLIQQLRGRRSKTTKSLWVKGGHRTHSRVASAVYTQNRK